MREKIEQIDKSYSRFGVCKSCSTEGRGRQKTLIYCIWLKTYSYEIYVCQYCDNVEVYKFFVKEDLSVLLEGNQITGKDKRRIAKVFPELRENLCEK